MNLEDYYPQGKRWWLRLQEKGGENGRAHARATEPSKSFRSREISSPGRCSTGAQPREAAMDERQKLYDDLKRYRTVRDLTTDEAAIEAIDVVIRETEERLAQLENEPPDQGQ